MKPQGDAMKPIARVHWIDGGREHSRDVYTMYTLNNLSRSLAQKDVVRWTCLTDTETIIPVYAPRPPETA